MAKLVIGDAEIDVGFDPIRSKLHHAVIIFDRFGQSFGAVLAAERGLEEIFGRGTGHGVELGGLDGHVEREGPLLKERIERPHGARRNDVNLAAEFDQAQFLHGARACGKLRFDQLDGAADAAGRNVILRDALNATEGDQVAETIKFLAPTRLRFYEAQTLPVAETARLKS